MGVQGRPGDGLWGAQQRRHQQMDPSTSLLRRANFHSEYDECLKVVPPLRALLLYRGDARLPTHLRRHHGHGLRIGCEAHPGRSRVALAEVPPSPRLQPSPTLQGW